MDHHGDEDRPAGRSADVRSDESLFDTLTRIAHAAVDGLHADHAGLTLLDGGGQPTTMAFTDDAAPEIDQAQYDADRGPCLAAFREARVVRVDSTAQDDRWPEFASAAVA